MDGVTLNGIVLLGQALDMSGSAGNDLRYVNELPSLAATACYHHKAGASCTPDGQVAAARKFGQETYVRALYAGHDLPTGERDLVAGRLAELTGLPVDYIRDHDLRVSATEFAHELLKDQQRELGAYDGRYVLPSTGGAHDPVADDPAMGQYVPGFVAAYNVYMRDELHVSIDDRYEAISFRNINAHWDWGPGGTPGNYATDLAAAMHRNPQLRLMVGAGYYDLVTPLGNAQYMLTHSDIPAAATTMHGYPSGHMPYLGDESRRALAHDLRVFLGGP
jgi:carboxypeptidase C (cathepsin A)